MLPLPETTLPVNSMTIGWFEQNLHDAFVLGLLLSFIDPVQNSDVSLSRLLSIGHVSLWAECFVVQLVSHLLHVIDVVLPNVLVFVIVL